MHQLGAFASHADFKQSFNTADPKSSELLNNQTRMRTLLSWKHDVASATDISCLVNLAHSGQIFDVGCIDLQT